MPDTPSQRTPLPAGTPADLQDFVRCRRDTVSIAPGELDWVPNMPDLDLEIVEGPGGSVTLRLSAMGGMVDISVPVSVVDGELVADTSNIPVPGDAASEWVATLNADLKANDMEFGDLDLRDGKLHLSKQKIVPTTAVSAGGEVLEPPPMPIPPPPRHVTDPIPEPVEVTPEASTTGSSEEQSTGSAAEPEDGESVPHPGQDLDRGIGVPAHIGTTRRWAKWQKIGVATAGAFVLAIAGWFIFVDDVEPPAGAQAEETTTLSTPEQPPETEDEPEEDVSQAEPPSDAHTATIGVTGFAVQLDGDAQTGMPLPYTLCATDTGSSTPIADTPLFITIGNDPGGPFASHSSGTTDASGCFMGELLVKDGPPTTQLLVSDGSEVAPVTELPVLPPDGSDPVGDQVDGSTSQPVLPGDVIHGGDITAVDHEVTPEGAQLFTITVAGDGMQYSQPGTGWYDVIVTAQGEIGLSWSANAAWFSGQFTDRGVRVGPSAPGQPTVDGAVVMMEFLSDTEFVMIIDSTVADLEGIDALDVGAFIVTVGVSVDEDTRWDSAYGVAGLP